MNPSLDLLHGPRRPASAMLWGAIAAGLLHAVSLASHAASTYAVPMAGPASESWTSSKLARVCVLRAPSKIGKMATYDFWDNQEKPVYLERIHTNVVLRSKTRLGSLAPGGHLLYERPAGPATIRVFENGPSVDLTTQAGRTYYVELKLSTFGAALSLMDEVAGAAASQKSQLAVQPAREVGGYDIVVPRKDRSDDSFVIKGFLGVEVVFPKASAYQRQYQGLPPKRVREKDVFGYRVVVRPKTGGPERIYYAQTVTFVVPEVVRDAASRKESQETIRLTDVAFVPLYGAALQYQVSACRRGGPGIMPCEFDAIDSSDDGTAVEVALQISEGLPPDAFLPAAADWVRAL